MLEAYTAADCAKMLDIPVKKLYVFIERGDLRAVDVSIKEDNPRWRILKSDFQSFVESRSSRAVHA